MFTYDAAKFILDYLRPLCKNEYSINDTHKFPSMLSSIPPLQDYEEDISYDDESLLTNIPIEDNNQLYHWTSLCWHEFVWNWF